LLSFYKLTVVGDDDSQTALVLGGNAFASFLYNCDGPASLVVVVSDMKGSPSTRL